MSCLSAGLDEEPSTIPCLNRFEGPKKIWNCPHVAALCPRPCSCFFLCGKLHTKWLERQYMIGHFWDFFFFIGRDWKNGNLSKVASGKSNVNQLMILLRSFQNLFCIEDIQGYPNLDLYFHLIIWYVCRNALKLSKKYNFAKQPSSKGYYRQV